MTRKKSSKQIANKGTNTAAESFANPELKQIEQLLQFMTEHNLEEFEYSRGDLRIRLRKPAAGVVVAAPRVMAVPEIIVPGSVEAPHASAGDLPAPAEGRSTEDLHLVKSPIVGTFYESPS